MGLTDGQPLEGNPFAIGDTIPSLTFEYEPNALRRGFNNFTEPPGIDFDQNAGMFSIDFAGLGLTNYAGFCIENGESISRDSTYTDLFVVTNLENAARGRAGEADHQSIAVPTYPTAGIGEVKAGRIRYLFDQYYLGTDAVNDGWTDITGAAFQLALWELVIDEDLLIISEDAAPNNFFDVSIASNTGGDVTVINLADSYLDAILALNYTDQQWRDYQSTTWNPVVLESNSDPSVGAADVQDVVIATPVTPPAIEIGNYVWEDTDSDGIQDACEMGIAGVTVELIKGGTSIASTQTDANGQYYFSSQTATDPNLTWTGTGADTALIANMEYLIRISNAEGGSQQVPLSNLALTTTDANANNSNDIDNDASLNGDNAEITYTTGSAGCADHSLDFGFVPILSAIGNYVWIDENSDGLQDEGEAGIPNVKVILKDDMGNPIDSTFTDANGQYLFPDLGAGDYFVDVDETTIPDGMTQTDGAFLNTNSVDGDDADTVNDDGDLGNKDHSGNGYPITLDVGEENLTADFGYNHNPTDNVNNPMGSPNAALGDKVWIDSDGDGVQDPNEVGVEGAIITIFGDPDGDGV
ncbi:MAG: SdrD B-like domain-containing protein, partial [Bacteroidota bacterium]